MMLCRVGERKVHPDSMRISILILADLLFAEGINSSFIRNLLLFFFALNLLVAEKSMTANGYAY